MSIRQGNSIIAQGAINNTLYVSNCITEIPQDIKLELNNGTLTLKAGSKVYVPNGAGVFDTVTIANDLTIPAWANTAQGILSIKPSNSGVWVALMNQQYSGGTAPTSSQYELWYDTTNNKIKTTSNTGSTWTDGYSLPLALITSNGSSWASIDQVFNGFGYIGSTVFALPGVKGLIPNGFNADGTLKNINMNITSVQTAQTAYFDYTDWVGHLTGQIGSIGQVVSDHYFEQPKEPTGVTGWTVWYNTNDNIIYLRCIGSGDSDDKWVVTQDLIAFHWSTNSDTRITSFKSKTAFRAVDYNDAEHIAHQAMPSSSYIVLTLGASWATYTAPADGYVVIRKNSTAANQYVKIINRTSEIGAATTSLHSGYDTCATLPVSKGDSFQVAYNADGITNYFRFVYANGAK